MSDAPAAPAAAKSANGDEPQRTGGDLLDAAAAGAALTDSETADLVSYYLDNEELPGDSEPVTLSVELGHGARKRTFQCQVMPIEWDEWQDARDRATDAKTGEFDAYVSSSWTVARALVQPRLGPTVARLQRENPDTAPVDAADLLRRMFRRQSGALLELSGKVLEISRLQSDANSVREVDAAKN